MVYAIEKHRNLPDNTVQSHYNAVSFFHFLTPDTPYIMR